MVEASSFGFGELFSHCLHPVYHWPAVDIDTTLRFLLLNCVIALHLPIVFRWIGSFDLNPWRVHRSFVDLYADLVLVRVLLGHRSRFALVDAEARADQVC